MDFSNQQKLTKEGLELGETTDEDLEPHYKSVFKSDSIKLSNSKTFRSQLTIDEWESIEFISNASKELRADYLNYLLDEYGTVTPKKKERLSYQEIATISRFIVRNFKKNKTESFREIFERAEFCLTKGKKTTQNLIIVGLFEGIQNTGSWYKINYKKGFDKWLKIESKKSWDELIEFWEGNKKK